MATAATGALKAPHGPSLQLLTRLHHSTGSGDHRRAASPWICLVMPHATAQIGRQRQGHASGQEGGVSIAVGSRSRLEQSPQPPRSPQRGWPQRWRSEPARRRVKCRDIDTSSGRPRVDERSRDGRPAAGGRHRARSGAACWPGRPAWSRFPPVRRREHAAEADGLQTMGSNHRLRKQKPIVQILPPASLVC